jgi:AraC family transcriptional regulator
MDNLKQFLIGLEPSPPPDHTWQEYSGYSIYSAEQDRSTWNRHSHDCTQITVASNPACVRAEWQSGSGQLGTKEMNGDMAWIVPPGVEHAIHWNRRATLVHIYLNDQFFDAMVQDVPEQVSSKLSPSLLVRDPFLIQIAKELYRELQFGPINEMFTRSVATLTATHLVRSYSSKPNALPVYRGGLGPSRERRVRQYIEEHLDRPLSLEELAKVAEISPNYFISLFQQSTGMTPHKYVVQQRVEHAKELLVRSKLPLLEIAYRCGFPDQSQFTTTFRRYIGVTPGQYRRQL